MKSTRHVPDIAEGARGTTNVTPFLRVLSAS